MKRRIKLRTVLRAAVVAFVLLLLWWVSLYYRIVTFEGVIVQPSLRADACIVLGASLWNDKPSPGLRERLDHALELYKAGVFPRFVVTGGLDAGGATITEAEGMRNYLMEHGVPEDAIFMDKKSRSTYENLLYARQITSTRTWHHVIIVTHSYHGARAEDIAKTVGYDVPLVSVTDSKVMNIPYHEARETLAFVKWQLTKLRLAFG